MITQTCASCDRESPDAKRCLGCESISYCSTTCQEEHWMHHIFDCKTDKRIDTAYHLARACRNNLIPVHPQTRTDYGFEKVCKVFGSRVQSVLLALWIGVFASNSISPQEVCKWREEGRLVQGIKAVFEALPPDNRGAFYPWFLHHQWLLDGTPVDSEIVHQSCDAFINKCFLDVWAFIGGSSSAIIEDVEEKVYAFPKDRRICFEFYVILLPGAHPHPTQGLWKELGFVAGDEQELGRGYQQLIRSCTFDEFCAAFETSSVPALFARHGPSMSHSRHFLDVMSDSPRSFKSVWSLKQYIDLLLRSTPEDRESDPPQLEQVAFVDYGFVNCKTPMDRRLLDGLYKRLFTKTRADALDLHAACIRGRLLEYAKGFVDLGPYTTEYARLLKNRYPL